MRMNRSDALPTELLGTRLRAIQFTRFIGKSYEPSGPLLPDLISVSVA